MIHLKVKIKNTESNSFYEASFLKAILSFKWFTDSDCLKITKYFIEDVKKIEILSLYSGIFYE